MTKHKLNRLLLLLALVVGFVGLAHAQPVDAQDIGVDWSVYQGPNGIYADSSDNFAIAQVGGAYGGSYVDQSTYNTQVSSAIAAKKRAHTYVWDQVGSSVSLQEQAMDHFLPQVKTPKGSIVALDYEAGASGDKAGNTAAIMAGMARIKQAGYTPLLYSYKPYLLAHVDYQQVLNAYPDSLWVAGYKDYSVTAKPDFAWFPSLPGISIWQFTSVHRAGGLDGDVDLLGVTAKGYDGITTNSAGKQELVTNSTNSVIKAGQAANNLPKTGIKVGDTVKVNLGAIHWANGSNIASFVKGQSYKVQQVNGTKVLLGNVLSWIDKSNVEVLNLSNYQSSSAKAYHDGNWTITPESGTFIANTSLRVWNWPGYSATGSYYYAGEAVHYYGYVRNGAYIYVAYRAYDGLTHYLAVRQSGVPLGSFK